MKVIRAGLCITFAFSMLALGAVEVWSESLLEVASAFLLLGWAVLFFTAPKNKIYWSPLNWPLLGLIGIGVLQLLFRVTPYAFLTRLELLKLSAYLILFFLTAQAFRERGDLEKLVWFLILLCFSVSLFGIIQHFTSVGTIYWFRPIPVGDIFGPHVNRNHFAGFVELTLPAGLALLAFRGLRREIFPLVTLLTIIPIGALILSGSRGGIISFAFEIIVLLILTQIQKEKGSSRLAAFAIVAFLAVLLVAWLGAGKAIDRFSTMRASDLTLSRRTSMFKGAAHIFSDHPFIGTGLGSIVVVYPRYETAYDGKVVNHVHNDYIELLAETGFLGGICGLAFLWILYGKAKASYVAKQSSFSLALHAGALAALCGLLLHSFVDFNLHIPSNSLLFLVQAYLATSVPLPSETAWSSR
jgi:O-antigen ligase